MIDLIVKFTLEKEHKWTFNCCKSYTHFLLFFPVDWRILGAVVVVIER